MSKCVCEDHSDVWKGSKTYSILCVILASETFTKSFPTCFIHRQVKRQNFPISHLKRLSSTGFTLWLQIESDQINPPKMPQKPLKAAHVFSLKHCVTFVMTGSATDYERLFHHSYLPVHFNLSRLIAWCFTVFALRKSNNFT